MKKTIVALKIKQTATFYNTWKLPFSTYIWQLNIEFSYRRVSQLMDMHKPDLPVF